MEKNNHCKKSKQVHSKDQLQVQEQVNEIICESKNKNMYIKNTSNHFIVFLLFCMICTPPRTPRISGPKSQVLKPTFLS